MTVNRSKLRAAVEFTRADLGESGTNYPHVRTLLAFAEQHLDTPEPVQCEAVEVVAHMYQHDETGRVGFVDQQQVDWGFEKNNPRLHLCGPLMTVAQHNRIMAAAKPDWRAHSINYARGEKCPETIETLQAHIDAKLSELAGEENFCFGSATIPISSDIPSQSGCYMFRGEPWSFSVTRDGVTGQICTGVLDRYYARGKFYKRERVNGAWSPWAELQGG
jgi:hypothetical protein